jgi:hypothetical protein
VTPPFQQSTPGTSEHSTKDGKSMFSPYANRILPFLGILVSAPIEATSIDATAQHPAYFDLSFIFLLHKF